MEANIEEALRAKDNAEKLFSMKDFAGARSSALKAQTFYPHLQGISQMVATFDVYAACEKKLNGEVDLYAILGVDPSAEKSTLKKSYKRIAVLLHPDKNKTVGADEAFKLATEAWNILSDSVKRSSYDVRRNSILTSAVAQSTVSQVSVGQVDTFWTVCTSCHVQYEYLRKYVNKRLSCKNCRGVFVAVETGAVPVAYCPWSSFVPEDKYGNQTRNEVSHLSNNSVCFSTNAAPGSHSGHKSDYGHNVSFQWNSSHGASDSNGYTSQSVNLVNQANVDTSRAKSNGNLHTRNHGLNIDSNGHNETLSVRSSRPFMKKRRGRPPKVLKMDVLDPSRNGNGETAPKRESGEAVVDGADNSKQILNALMFGDLSIKKFSSAPAFDSRELLMDKARTVIRKKLEEMRSEDLKNEKLKMEVSRSSVSQTSCLGDPASQSEQQRLGSMAITVPDPDFHDFDMDRSEECFKPRQIWALYDEEDGMPRLYCLIRQVISVNPFLIDISYLNSKTDSEFGSVNWISHGFTKACGNFRVFHSETVDQVNIFSHLLGREKAGRGGVVRIYPKCGDVWAVYRNWSSNWDRATPKEVRHQYEMVEVLDDYSDELGVCVTPLTKLEGYKTVYQRNSNKSAIRWIPRREMLRFSHQVPSCLLKGEALNLPSGCWDLDPAATPEELLHAEEKPSQSLSQAGS